MQPSEHQLLQLIQRMNRGQAMTTLYFWNVILANQGNSLETPVQLAFAREVASDISWAEALVQDLVSAGNRTLVTEEGLAVLFRLVVKHAPDGPMHGPPQTDSLLRAILMQNSLSSTEPVRGDSIEDFIRVEMRAQSFDAEQPRDVIARYAGFIEWSRSESALRSANY